MINTNLSNNLFNYATSELSQDAFICYLASFAIRGNDNNKVLYRCALEFINLMLPENDKMIEGEFLDDINDIKPICKQCKCIDVLIHAKGYSIIIEDKTFTGMREGQIGDYRESLIKEGVLEGKIRTIYYKIIEQSGSESVNFEFDRKRLLELFSDYYDNANDKIFKDYVDYLRYIDDLVNKYIDEKTEDWKDEQYIGFFSHLKNDNVVKDGYWTVGWGYVPNPSGGFMGLWWCPLLISNLYSMCKGVLYLQIEYNKIVLKLYNDDLNESEEEQVNNHRYVFKKEIDSYIRNGNYCVKRMSSIRITAHTVSLYYLEYNECNYKDQILKMEELFSDIKNKYDNGLKGIMFDTNRTYYPDDELEMLKQRKIWAKGNPKRYLYSFNKGDYVLYYSKRDGVFAIGIIIDDEPVNIEDGYGLSRNVEIILPKKEYIEDISKQESVSASEIKKLLNKNFYFASTIKSPFLNEREVMLIIDALNKKYIH